MRPPAACTDCGRPTACKWIVESRARYVVGMHPIGVARAAWVFASAPSKVRPSRRRVARQRGGPAGRNGIDPSRLPPLGGTGAGRHADLRPARRGHDHHGGDNGGRGGRGRAHETICTAPPASRSCSSPIRPESSPTTTMPIVQLCRQGTRWPLDRSQACAARLIDGVSVVWLGRSLA
jgi:hypothetical protein